MNEAHNDQQSRDAEKPSPDAAPSSAASVAAMIGTRNLKIIIITMPFVFLIVVALIIAVFGRPGGPAQVALPVAAQTEGAIAGAPIAFSIPQLPRDGSGGIILPQGAEIGSMAFDGDRLALRVDVQDDAMIVIYDLQQNIVVQTIPVLQEQ